MSIPSQKARTLLYPFQHTVQSELLRRQVAKWLVGLLPADPSERLTLDLSIRSLRPLLCHWVRAANAEVESKHSLWESAWRDIVAHPDIAEKVLTDAKARHELGKLFSRERKEEAVDGGRRN